MKPTTHPTDEITHPQCDIDINTATEQDLAKIPMVGPEKARLLVEHRPFDSWTEIARMPGLSLDFVMDLKTGGAQLGEPL